MKKVNRITYFVAAIFAAIVFFLSSIVGGGTVVVRAATSAKSAYEGTNVLDDLKKSTINDEPFDFSEWNFDERKDTQIISFIEFCYSFYEKKQSDYGLYIYVYNPKGIDYVYDSDLNAIQLAVSKDANDESVGYNKYPLKFLNKSTEAGYEGLFLKYKIVLTDSETQTILSTLNSTERVYKVGEIELLIKGEVNPQFYGISLTYKYSGYAEGYGSSSATEDTLQCSTSGLTSISPSVHHTFYRASGSNGKNSFTQDTLQSVYFSVPNSMLDEYGELIEVRATWLKTMLQWAFVTGNQEFYDFVKQYMGLDMSHGKSSNEPMVNNIDLDYISKKRIYAIDTFDRSFAFDYGQYIYEDKNHSAGYNQGWFSGLYWSGSGVDSADNYVVPREEILETMKSYHDDYDTRSNYVYDTTPAKPQSGWFYTKYTWSTPYGGEYLTVDGKTYPYSKALFESWDEKATVADISRTKIQIDGNDTELKLTSQKIGRSFWQKLFGGSRVESSTVFDGIEAIHQVEEKDIKSTAKATCDNLFIDESDYEDFKDFFDKATKAKETVFLIRFDVGEYAALEAHLGVTNNSVTVTPNITFSSSNARIFKQNCYLGFDLIHLKFEGEKGITVIPVLMSPQTLVTNGTPALETNSDLSGCNNVNWKMILGLIALVFILILTYPIWKHFIGFIIDAIIWVIMLPFKMIGAVFKRIKERRRKAKENKANNESQAQQPKPPDLTGNVKPQDVDAYLDSIDWDSVDWSKLDGKGG